VKRRLTFTISILALVLMGSNCTFVASSNTRPHNNESEHKGGNDGGLLIVVTDGDLGDRQVVPLRSRTTSVARSSAEPIDPPTGENLAPSAVPLLSAWGWALLVGSLGAAGYLALRGRRDL
jgi:hypothetical protein